MTTATTTKAKADTLRDLTVFRLANEAGCSSPDDAESAGAKFLDAVRDAVIEAIEYDPEASDYDEQASEIADNAPDVYTHAMWSEFVDLAAYNEDPTELGAEADDMDKCARVCLYMIADRLARVLFEMVADVEELDDNA